MTEVIKLCMGFLAAVLKSRAGLQAENLALRHQLCVYQRSVKTPKVKPSPTTEPDLLHFITVKFRSAHGTTRTGRVFRKDT